MREATVSAWMQDLTEAFEIGTIIGDQVIILSCSTGGTLVATGIEMAFFLKLFSTVFAPNFGLQDKMAQLWIWPLARCGRRLSAARCKTTRRVTSYMPAIGQHPTQQYRLSR